MDLQPGQVEIGDPTRLLGDLDVDAGAARHPHEMIGQDALFKQRLEGLGVVRPEPAGERHVTAEIFQDHGDVDPLARGA
ncbi:hypothetical protein D3C80_1479040 [compost metagenome]